jgi:hypothetical protein
MTNFQGKSYSLYTGSDNTDDYYETVTRLTDACLQKIPGNDAKKLLALLKKASKYKTPIHKLLKKKSGNTLPGSIKEELKNALSIYTKDVKKHLKSLSLLNRFDSALNANEEQYHLYMLEIELVNRIYLESFNQSKYKFALFPHCLRDFRLKCLSEPGDVDDICKGCTKDCYIHLGGTLLKKYGIEPYISTISDQERILKEVKNKHQSVGVLGIACIPELARGMRLALRLDIPPIGIPLDVNRCSRWMGTAYETSINLKELEKLVESL